MKKSPVNEARLEQQEKACMEVFEGNLENAMKSVEEGRLNFNTLESHMLRDIPKWTGLQELNDLSGAEKGLLLIRLRDKVRVALELVRQAKAS